MLRALILAAGRGERMRPLSDRVPKPLLPAGGRGLIEWQIAHLAAAGVTEMVINLAHLGAAIEAALGDGGRFGVRLHYSREGASAADALETLGGVAHALAPLLGIAADADAPTRAAAAEHGAPFLVVAGDIYTDFDYASLRAPALSIAEGKADAHLVLVDNPPYHPAGDMGLDRDGRIVRDGARLTFASIGVYAPRLFAEVPIARRALFPWMYTHVDRGRVTGEHFRGAWHNVGTPADLALLDAELRRATA